MTIGSASTERTRLYGLAADTKPTQAVEPFTLFIETDKGNVFEYSGGQWTKIVSDGAAHVTQDGWAPSADGTTGLPRHHNDVPNYTAHDTGGALAAAETDTATFTTVEAVTAILVNPWSSNAAFLGVYVTLNAGSASDARDNLQSVDDAIRYFVPAGMPRLLKAGGAITNYYLTAIDAEGAELNYVDVEPYG